VVGEGDPIAPLPAGTTFAEAAAVPDGFVLGGNCLRLTGLHEGQRIVVYGASGSIGTAAVQLAKDAGAHVTAVCNTAQRRRRPLARARRGRRLPARDFTTRDETWDVVVDAVGKLPYRRARRALAPTGRFVSTDGGHLWQNPFLALTRFSPGRRMLFPFPAYTQDKIRLAKDLVEACRYRAVVDRTYPLGHVVEATRYVETGQKLGNVVLDVFRRAEAG
jgi:NADPH:quinone reductase-like Zn-dependent oxidoreductase